MICCCQFIIAQLLLSAYVRGYQLGGGISLFQRKILTIDWHTEAVGILIFCQILWK